MRVQTEEWRRFIPGVRMYKGKKTLFYNGEKLYDSETGEHLVYNQEEQLSWEVIIVLPGVEIIPQDTFPHLKKLKIVIMADTVRRIERGAFFGCESLSYVRLSTSLEYIGMGAFCHCSSLTSIFVPPSCREIDIDAFDNCQSLIIFHVPQGTEIGHGVIGFTALFKASPFADRIIHFVPNLLIPTDFRRNQQIRNELIQWIKNINQGEQFALHRACSSFNPLEEIIYEIVKRQGISSLKKQNSIGVTASQYLQENPYSDIEERKIINRYVLDMMGEAVDENLLFIL
ncbi:hypothetical protein CTEN210_00839 [Chaetoceros tenuissimus]|uniref:Leucine-rich repeat domain-containing protein n=1 Tax=Chaetoceros tenuissimus TaxID=426638 RepID=A0AAD3CFX1_9STRA|nr:hypothetical protein CTEN210_00839 [Chaetoceros tenuissimus]